jgi:TPP-dependent indolepyruvate ferredoxin oxidoreductase alpha subunit
MSFGAEPFIFSLLSKNIMTKTYRTIILLVVVVVVYVYGCETWSVTFREKHRQKGKTFVNPPKTEVCKLCCKKITHVSALLSHHLQGADNSISVQHTALN